MINDIARFILQNLQNCKVDGYMNGQFAMYAWGAEKITGSEAPDNYGQGWIRMRVAGGKLFTGWVRIALDFGNNYNITFETFHNKTGESTTVIRRDKVPMENLATVIDDMVEGR